MGLDAGFKTQQGQRLFYFRKFYELDDYICHTCKIGKHLVLDDSGTEIPNEGYEYIVPKTFWDKVYKELKPFYLTINKYSDRVIDALDEGEDNGEVEKKDISIIQDCLYNLDSDFDDVRSSFFLFKCRRLYEFAAFMIESEIEEDIIYWRSY